MLNFVLRERSKLTRIGMGGLLVGGNAGILYIAAELATAYAGAKAIGAVTVGLATLAAALMDFKKKLSEKEPVDVSEDDL